MTDKKDSSHAAIQDARALLDTMLAHDWQELHVVSGGIEIFLARREGCANPMRARMVAAPSIAPPLPLGKEVPIKAPHVATVVSLAQVGKAVAAGDTVVVLRVLDEEHRVVAAGAGVVESVGAAVGDLVEFDMPLLTLREAA